MKVFMTFCTPNPENVIGQAAAICYDADTSPEANSKRMLKLLEYGHDSPLRFASASFSIIGVSRAESHQHVRTAHAGILERSQRYVDAFRHEFIEPPCFANFDDYMRRRGRDLVKESRNYYADLLASGVAKEDARYWLPEGMETSLNMTGNFQMWRGFLKARLSKGSQWEIKAVATEIHKQLYAVAPNIFGDLCP
jgi:thymidylate synthase (FAD)